MEAIIVGQFATRWLPSQLVEYSQYSCTLVPQNCNTDIIDDIIKVSNEDAFATAQALAEKDGLLGGISTGANVWAAIQLAKRPEMAGKKIVTIGCSFGERYLSTPLAEKAREEMMEAASSQLI